MDKRERKEIKEDLARNHRERLEFVTRYAQWVKRTPNRIWSRQQRIMIDDVIRAADEAARERGNIKR